MTRLTLFALYLLLVTCCAQEQDSNEYLELYEKAMIESGIPYNQTLVSDLSSLESENIDFECTGIPNSFIQTQTKSIHELMPYHVKVVGAVGDSITAAFGAEAKCLLQMRTEYRGVSWSAGGDPTYTTLPNIIKKFNPSVKGFSVKTGKTSSANAHLNRAVTGAVSAAIPDQVRDLIQQIKEDETINMEEDWKVVTMWIGGNDLCAFCKDKEGKSAVNYVNNIKEGLDILREELPRTFVNLVQILDVTKLGQLKTGLFCDLIHLFVCPCVAKSKYWEVTSQASRDYNALLEEMIANTPEYHDSDNFAVVLQPFFKNTGLPTDANGNGDGSYFGLDCFHFTVKGHSEAARALWNNMMQPVGSKSDRIDWGNKPTLKCPTMAFPYFFTHKNSLSSFGGVNPDPNSSQSPAPTNLLGILLGTGLAVVVIALAMVIVVIATVYKRRQRRRSTLGVSVGVSLDTEKTRLIFS